MSSGAAIFVTGPAGAGKVRRMIFDDILFIKIDSLLSVRR